MVLDLTNEQLGVLRRALEARARDMRMHLATTLMTWGFDVRNRLRFSYCDRSKR